MSLEKQEKVFSYRQKVATLSNNQFKNGKLNIYGGSKEYKPARSLNPLLVARSLSLCQSS